MNFELNDALTFLESISTSLYKRTLYLRYSNGDIAPKEYSHMKNAIERIVPLLLFSASYKKTT